MRIGIAFRLNLVVLAVVLSVGGGFGTLFAVRETRAIWSELDRRIGRYGAQVAVGAGHALADGDARALDAIVKGTMLDPDVAYVLVESADGQARAARWAGGVRGAVREYAFPVRVEIDAKGTVEPFGPAARRIEGAMVGRMAIGVDLSSVFAARRRVLASILLGVLAATAVAALLGWALLKVLLLGPVTPLIEGIRAIGAGDLSSRITLGRDDEMGDIARAFNDMAARLSSTLVSKGELEQTVALRTGELTDALAEGLRAHQALAEREEHVRLLLDSTAEAIFGVDPDWRCTFCNAACLRLLGYGRPEDLAGRSMQDILHGGREGERFPREECRLDRKQGDIAEHHVADERFTKADGTTFPAECWIHPIARAGEVIGGVVTFVDLTERRQMEAELLKMRKLESLGVLAGGIAHDFNNMLSGIVGSVSLAKEMLEGRHEARELLEEAEAAVARTKRLTRQLLTFAKGGVPVKSVLSIRDVVEDAVRFALSGSAVKAECCFQDGLWRVEADQGQIGQAIQNLVINAAQAMPGGGTMAVSCENAQLGAEAGMPLAPGRYVKITVADRGVGIAPEHLPRIFDPYFTGREGGSGLGLATVYAIVRSHLGHVAVKSEPGKGATFDVWLPVTDRAIGTLPARPVRAARGGRVLVMDDDAAVRRVAQRMLTTLGYEVVAVADGREAVTAWREAKGTGTPFDVVLVDLTVPGGMGGAETVAELRALDRSVRAIVSSGYSNDPTMANYREMGFVGIVPKPYTVQELSRAVADALVA